MPYAVYGKIINPTTQNFILTNITSNQVENIEIHKTTHTKHNNMYRAHMQKFDTLTIPANTTLTLKPKSWHLMFGKDGPLPQLKMQMIFQGENSQENIIKISLPSQ